MDTRQMLIAQLMSQAGQYPYLEEEVPAYSDSNDDVLRLSKEVNILTDEVRRLSAEVNRQATMNSRLMGEISRHFSSDEQVLRDIKVALEGLKR